MMPATRLPVAYRARVASVAPPALLQPPLMAVCRNPLLRASDLVFEPVAVGTTLASLRPEASGPVRCVVNGEPCYPITSRQWQHHLRLTARGRADEAKRYLTRSIRRALVWQRLRLKPGDVVLWHVVPQDRDTLRTIIAVVIAIVYVYFTWDANGAWAILQGAALGLQIANLLVPPSQQDQAQQQGGSIYSTSLTGNQARLDQPIWRNCGLVKITPPFAAQPYYEYLDPDGDNIDNDQYYSVVFAIGIGKHDVLRTFIGKTPISSFQDVLVANYLPPGVQPTRALCNVVTSTEVTGLECDTSRAVGGYVACQPQRKALSIGIDMACPQGLGKEGALTVTWRVMWREIDDLGRAVSDYQVLANETRTANTNTPQRWSNRYILPGPARAEILIQRTDVKDTSSGARHSLQWIGLRAYLNRPAPLNPNTAHFEVVMRASEQLSGQSQRDFSMIVQAYARTWSTDSGWSCELHDWDNYTATRNPSWYALDLLIDPLWGEGRDEAHVDRAGFAGFATLCDTRQDRFDYTFAESANARDAVQLIVAAGRARVFERLGVLSLARDALVTLPRTAFSPRNTVPNSMVVTEVTPRPPNIVDGIVLEYTSNVTWDIVTIDCPCPGYTVTDEDDPRYNPALPKMTRPLYLRAEGIKGAKHAERHGLFEAYKRFYRRRSTSLTTEMQGAVLSFFEAVRWQPEFGGIGQSGDVAFWDPETLVMGLTEPLVFSDTGFTWLSLLRDDGTVTDAVRVSPGPTANDVILPAAPDFELVLDDGTRERPKFFASYAATEVMRIDSIDDGGRGDAEEGEQGAQLYNVSGFIDDERVHLADVHLLPGPGEIQDPIDDGLGASAFDTTINLNGRSNASGSSAVGIRVTGMQPEWVLNLELPPGQVFDGWSAWAHDYASEIPSPPNAWASKFKVTADGGGTSTFGADAAWPNGEAARAAFVPGTITGASAYTFWIEDTDPDNNRGGLSIRIRKI